MPDAGRAPSDGPWLLCRLARVSNIAIQVPPVLERVMRIRGETSQVVVIASGNDNLFEAAERRKYNPERWLKTRDQPRRLSLSREMCNKIFRISFSLSD